MRPCLPYGGAMDAFINSTTGDYTGERISHLANAVYLRIMTPKGTWWADASLGSRLHELAREKDVQRIHRLAEQYAAQALQPLIADERAQSVTVRADQPHNGRCNLHIEVVDNTGKQQTFRYFIRVA